MTKWKRTKRARRSKNKLPMSRAEKILFGILLCCCALLAGCTAGSRTRDANSRSSSIANSSTSARTVVHVFDAQPSPSATGGEILIPASLSVEDTAIVLAERDGRIVTLRGQEGARVGKGEVLAAFNDDDQRSQLQQAQIEVSRLKVEEQQYDALVKLNRSELDRELSLFKDGVSSKREVEQAQYKLEQSTHEYEKSRLATQSAQAHIESIKIEFAKSTVRAPISGIITRRYVTLGTNVARNDKLFEVSQLSPLEVKFQLPQTERERLSPGQLINLSAAGSEATMATARIRRIDAVADATSNTLGYLADITGGSGLMPGLAVNVHLPRPMNSLAFWVPRAAFPATAALASGASVTLFTVEGERVSARTVIIGAIQGDQVEIVSGLAANERVILTPPTEMKDGDTVEVSPG
jgi:RND family efflux transporter MFP subunit